MRTFNFLVMILTALLCAACAYDIAQHGAGTWNTLFFLTFGTFAVRRFMLRSRYS